MAAIKTYKLKKPRAGVDVSAWQGDIDWELLSHWIDFAIIRCGSDLAIDKYSLNNQIACEDLGIPYGVYWFSYARTPEHAKLEAKCLFEAMHGKQSYPIYFDYEEGSFNGTPLEKELVSDIVFSFCETVEESGCYAGVYTNTSFKNKYFNERVLERFDLWEANWSKGVSARIHQFSNKGKLPGINGNVDLNLCYYDYPSLIKDDGFNGF